MLTRIQAGRVIDPGHLDTIADILVQENKIIEIVKAGQKEAIGPVSRIIDASGKIVCPGFIDMHVHLREPGHEHKETTPHGRKGSRDAAQQARIKVAASAAAIATKL